MSAARCPSRPDDTAPQSLREPGTVSLAATTLPHTAAGKASGIAGGSGVADAPVCRFRDADGSPDDGLEETLYYTQDANCNVTALVNTSGGGVERYTYDAYGKVTFRQNDWSLQAVQGSPDGAASAYDNQKTPTPSAPPRPLRRIKFPIILRPAASPPSNQISYHSPPPPRRVPSVESNFLSFT